MIIFHLAQYVCTELKKKTLLSLFKFKISFSKKVRKAHKKKICVNHMFEFSVLHFSLTSRSLLEFPTPLSH